MAMNQPQQPATQTAVRAVLQSMRATGILDSMEDKYDNAMLTTIKRRTALRRGAIKLVEHDDLGKFKPVYTKLSKIAKKNYGDEKFIKACDKLEKEIRDYLGKFNDDGSRKKKSLGKTTSSTGRRDRKLDYCTTILNDLALWKAQRLYPNEVAALQDFEDRVARGDQISVDDLERFRASNAQILLALHPDTRNEDGGGTSDVAIIRNADGTTAYAFKGIDGESSQMGLAKGSGTMREAMTSSACQMIKQAIGLDFGFPATTLATVDFPEGSKTGALVEGINGAFYPEQPESWDLIEDPEKLQRLRSELQQQQDAFVAQIPRVSLQKILLYNLAVCQFDIKFENIAIENGEPKPFDGGASFYTQEGVDRDLKTDWHPVVPGAAFLSHPGANQPFDPNLVNQFVQINEANLVRDLKTERDRLAAQSNQLNATMLADRCLDMCGISIRTVKELLQQNPPLSMADFVQEYHRVFSSRV